MNDKNEYLRVPVTFLVAVLLLEGLLAVLTSIGWVWGGVFLFVLISTIQIITLILIWYVFKLLIRMSDRLKNIEDNQTKRELRTTESTLSTEGAPSVER
jgi:hypothetical protein